MPLGLGVVYLMHYLIAVTHATRPAVDLSTGLRHSHTARRSELLSAPRISAAQELLLPPRTARRAALLHGLRTTTGQERAGGLAALQ